LALLVVKAGGRALMENMDNILDSIAAAVKRGDPVVFIHGGGDLVTEYSKRLGVEPRFVVSPSGVRSRYTTREELEVFVMVLGGLLNKSIAVGLARRGLRPVGLTGVDGLVLLAQRRKRIVVLDEETGRRRVIPGGYTGKIVSVNTGLLDSLIAGGYTPVLAPIAYDPEEATLLNVDGDQAAARVAAALRASTLIVLTDVDGLLLDGRLVERLTVSEARRLVEEGRVGKGMNRKLIELAMAVEEGLGRAVIANAAKPDPLAAALRGEGTVIEPG